MEMNLSDRLDHYSYSQPHQVRIKHLELDLAVQFEQHTLKGTAVLTLERPFAGDLILDTRDLNIERVESGSDSDSFKDRNFQIGAGNRILGTPLTIHLNDRATRIRIHYSTNPNASGLQWLGPEQTAGRGSPFLFTQSQATHARSWIPLQDTPQVRFTFNARTRVPENLLALMSAPNDPRAERKASYDFRMPYPIPSYLMAMAVGDLDFREASSRAGVYAERPVIEMAAREFEDIERMIQAIEAMFGSYQWGRYDVLVLPPSFPVGGMENPCLTFATPTIIAGDKSLISLLAHELAHSWSSNLVSNATWDDFWLNEGLTVYIERRIVERLYGPEREEMEAALGLEELEAELARTAPKAQALHGSPNGRDPNSGLSRVPYEKGALLFRSLEQAFGRERFDTFLRSYFHDFAYQSVTTAQFVTYLRENLFRDDPQLAARIPLDEWINGPGIPKAAALPVTDAFLRIETEARRWLEDEISLGDIPTSAWTTPEWLHFLRSLGPDPGKERMKDLDAHFHFTDSGNSEIENQWLLMAIQNSYEPADARLERFLTTIGRRKYVKPLYSELVKTRQGKERALNIYRKAQNSYHPITRAAVDEVLESSRFS